MRVLVIPEHPRYDQYILKPVVEQLFKHLGKPARVDVLANPVFDGVSQILKSSNLERVAALHPMHGIFLLFPDRDGNEGRASQLAMLEASFPGTLFGCAAIEELEIWMLALHAGELYAPWVELRAETQLKESAQRWLDEKWPAPTPSRGRKTAMAALTATSFRTLLRQCPELQELCQKVATHAGKTD